LLRLLGQGCQKWQEWTHVGDAAQGDGVVEDGDGAVAVAEVLERLVDGADRFGGGVVARLDELQHFHGGLGCYTNATGGVAGDAEVAKVDDGRLLTDAADDQLGVHKLDQLAKGCRERGRGAS